MKRTTLIPVIALLFAASSLYALTGREIMERTEKLAKPQTTRAQSVMKIYRNGELRETKEFEMTGKKYGDDSRALIEFLRPTRIKFLMHSYKSREDNQWLKTTGGKPKRIAGGDRGNSFVHSHLSYEDLQSREIDDYDYRYLGDETSLGEECYKVEAIKKSSDRVYEKVILFVRKSDHFILAIQFFQKGKLLKYLHNYDIRNVDGILTPFKAVMFLPGNRGKTELLMKSVRYNIPVADSAFSKATL
ncbi:MAG: outer membrane lipoprotein-sorting protein [Spirochaetes bacterium]|nr:outer membrane lipoprotein-sorting protein [Spirochaetota bacterium]